MKKVRHVIPIRFNKREGEKKTTAEEKDRKAVWRELLDAVLMSLKWQHGHKSGIKNGHPLNGSCMLGPVSEPKEDQRAAGCASRALILYTLSGKGRRNWIFHSCYYGGGNLLLFFLRVIKYSVSAPLVFDTFFSPCVLLAWTERLAVFHRTQQRPQAVTC